MNKVRLMYLTPYGYTRVKVFDNKTSCKKYASKVRKKAGYCVVGAIEISNKYHKPLDV